MRLAIAQTAAQMTTVRQRLDWLGRAMPGLPDNGVQDITGWARAYGIAIHYGCSKVADGVFHNAAQCFGSDGTRLGGHSKPIFPPGFEADHFTQGTGCEVFDDLGLRVGSASGFSETMLHVALMGARLVPTALAAKWQRVADGIMPTWAFENAVFVTSTDGEVISQAGSAAETLVDIDATRLQKAQKQLPCLTGGLPLGL